MNTLEMRSYTIAKGGHKYLFHVARGRELALVSALLDMAMDERLNLGLEDVLAFLKWARRDLLAGAAGEHGRKYLAERNGDWR
jgi:hypothetical protein